MWEEAHASQSNNHVMTWLDSNSQPVPPEEGEPPAGAAAADAPLMLEPEQTEPVAASGMSMMSKLRNRTQAPTPEPELAIPGLTDTTLPPSPPPGDPGNNVAGEPAAAAAAAGADPPAGAWSHMLPPQDGRSASPPRSYHSGATSNPAEVADLIQTMLANQTNPLRKYTSNPQPNLISRDVSEWTACHDRPNRIQLADTRRWHLARDSRSAAAAAAVVLPNGRIV